VKDIKDVLEGIDKARDIVSAISQGKQRWTMSVPARVDSDPDLVISHALTVARTMLEAQDMEIAQLRKLLSKLLNKESPP
jgi:hypothetical protein